MRVCAVTPHMPPEQAANALLPRQLGDALAAHGVTTSYVSHPPVLSHATASGDAVLVPRRGRGVLARTRAGALLAAAAMARGARTPIQRSDLVHLHGNGFIIEVAQRLAVRYGKPYVVTLYGTDIWHHDARRHARFGRVVRNARCRVFYSRGLRSFGQTLGLAPDPSEVIYAPVPPAFRAPAHDERETLRRELGAGNRPIVLTVKRLHEVAGYDVLLRAVPRLRAAQPDAQFWIIGEGALRPALEAQARDLGVASHVRFLGLVANELLWQYYAAADLFVLPSRLESWGTVMLEALACGTPVVATETAGGAEVHMHFPDDVTLAPVEDAEALASAAASGLQRGTRVSDGTADRLRTQFSTSACAAAYLDVYRRATRAL